MIHSHLPISPHLPPQGEGVLPETFGEGVRPAFQNPYPMYDKTLRFSLHYLLADPLIDTLLHTALQLVTHAVQTYVKSIVEGFL